MAPSAAAVPPQPDPWAPAVRSEFELDAFEAIRSENDPEDRLDAAEAFLVRYPDSELRHLVLRLRWNAFALMGDLAAVAGTAEAALAAEAAFFEGRLAALEEPRALPGYDAAVARHREIGVAYYESLIEAHNGLANWRDAIRFGEQGLAVEAEWWDAAGRADPDSAANGDARARHDGVEAFFFRHLMTAHRELGNDQRTIEYARRTLERVPGDVAALVTLAATMAERRVEADEAWWAAAEASALQALEVLDSLAGATEPEIGSEGARRLRSETHNALGLTYFRRGRLGAAQDAFLLALESMDSDPVTHYRLGVAYANDGKNGEAIDALARAVHFGYPGAEARDALIRVYETVHGSLDGMESVIENVERSTD